MARLALALFLVFFPMVLKPSSRAGVGTGEHTGSCAALRALRTSWVMNWASKPAWVVADCPEIEFVAEAWGGYGTGWEARAIERDYLALHPNGPVLILNEPNDPYQANLTCEEAGQSVEQYANDLLADYPGAKLIVGGILVGDYGARSVEAGIAFAECMLGAMDSIIAGAITGWHWHFYPFYSSDPAISKAGITALAEWTHAQGKEAWITEIGLLASATSWPESVKITWMQEMIYWLDNSGVVDRWSFFIALCDSTWPCPPTLELLNDDGTLTVWGRIYAQR